MGGEGLDSVFTDFLAISSLGSAWSFARRGWGEACRSFEMGAVIGGCASRDICLDVLGFAVGLRCPFLGGGVNTASYLSWTGQGLNQNLNSKCVVHMKLFKTLEHFEPP